jgi:tRNA(fMet)-specific endonuclease VapC
MYLLDTNVCIRFLNKKSPNIKDKLRTINPGEIRICSVVKAELFYGAYKSKNLEKNLKTQREFFNRFRSLPFDDKAAETYGKIRSSLEKSGNIIGPNDLMIAAIAIANDAVLVTHNCDEFNRVEGLEFEDWESHVK